MTTETTQMTLIKIYTTSFLILCSAPFNINDSLKSFVVVVDEALFFSDGKAVNSSWPSVPVNSWAVLHVLND